MQIQQGVVKYKDRTDLICNYGITEDGKQYYFLDDKPLPNGNIIATTALVEAIDPTVKASHAGVITRDGKVVIPLENKMVKNLGNNVLLVEKAVPTSKNVLESIGLKNIPDAATKLVTTPATIKDRLMLKMENEGRFVFNDQFSEASIFDYDGKNLINNEYFSFVGMNSKKIYFSKNTVDSEIVEYSLFPEKVAIENADKDKIKVEEVAVENRKKIENAINEKMEEGSSTMAGKSVPPIVNDSSVGTVPVVGKHVAVRTGPVPSVPIVPKEGLAPVEAVSVAPKEVPVPVEPVPVASKEGPVPVEPVSVAPKEGPVPVEPVPVTPKEEPIPVEPVSKNDDKEEQVSKDNLNSSLEDKIPIVPEDEIVIPVVDESDDKKEVDVPIEEQSNKEEENLLDKISEDNPEKDDTFNGKLVDASEVAKVVGEELADIEDDKNDESINEDRDLHITFADEVNEEEKKDLAMEDEKEDYNDSLLDDDLFKDSLLRLDKIDMDYEIDKHDEIDDYDDKISDNMNFIDDVTKSMANLIDLNKKQSSKILDYEKLITRLRRNGNDITKKNKSLEDEIKYLNGKVRNYETIVSKLENKNRELDERVQDQNKKIKKQEEEIKSLKPSATSKEELLKLIQDANSLLDEDDMSYHRAS